MHSNKKRKIRVSFLLLYRRDFLHIIITTVGARFVVWSLLRWQFFGISCRFIFWFWLRRFHFFRFHLDRWFWLGWWRWKRLVCFFFWCKRRRRCGMFLLWTLERLWSFRWFMRDRWLFIFLFFMFQRLVWRLFINRRRWGWLIRIGRSCGDVLGIIIGHYFFGCLFWWQQIILDFIFRINRMKWIAMACVQNLVERHCAQSTQQNN
mmetsp:Transcript_5846/g.10636  ORF Transcript_5846/g.10636 Transcript_5846/m.10636 type:complete len:206 (+) Transcript_5846:1154-1771(+)